MPDATERAVPVLADWLRPFQSAFTAPSWQHAMVLIMGAILVPGRRTVASALRLAGLHQTPHFTNYHRVLHRNRWSARWLSRGLLGLLNAAFVPPDQPVMIGLDDTIGRRWGAKIKKRAIYCDPVRSSNGHFVKANGLRWLSVMFCPRSAGPGAAGRCHS
jgi:hypothetical protein